MQSRTGTKKIVASISCIKHRRHNLYAVLQSVVLQCDSVILHLDFKPAADELPNTDKLTVYTHYSQTSEIRTIDAALNADTYYFMIDDDIIYPANYMNTMISMLNAYNNKPILCVHGSIIDFKKNDNWYHDRTVFHFASELYESKIVNVPGAGTSCFYTGSFTPDIYMNLNMTDIQIARQAKINNIPILCINRALYWLKPIDNSGECIYGNTGFYEKRNKYIHDNIEVFQS